MKETEHTRPRRWIAVVYVGLLVMVVPWYWPAANTRHLWGFPFWSLASLGAGFATALFTAWVYWTSDDSN
jgi:hypothetical protein